MLRYANYQGNVEHMMGQQVMAPYLRKGEPTQTVKWVAIEAVYDFPMDRTRVEFFGTVVG